MSRYGDFVRAYKEPDPVYGDTEPKDILCRYVGCFVSRIECPDGHWCFVYRDASTGLERESAEPRTYDREDNVCLRIKTGAAPVEGEPFGVFDFRIEARPGANGDEGEVVIVTDTGIEFSVCRGDVRFGPELETFFMDLVLNMFDERYRAEDEDDTEGDDYVNWPR